MLTKLNNYNNFPDYLLPDMPVPGTRIHYRHLKGKQDYKIASNGGITPAIIHQPFKLQAVAHTTDPKTNKNYPIAMATAQDAYGKILSESFLRNALWIVPQENGDVILTTGSPESDALFTYIELGPFLKGSPAAGNGDAVIFERIDFAKEAKADLDNADKMVEAYMAAKALSDEEVMDAALVLGMETSGVALEKVRRDVAMSAKSDPQGYLTKVSTEKFADASVLRYALKHGIAEIDEDARRLIWGGSEGGEIMGIARTDKDNVVNEWVNYASQQPVLKEALSAAVAEHKENSAPASSSKGKGKGSQK